MGWCFLEINQSIEAFVRNNKVKEKAENKYIYTALEFPHVYTYICIYTAIIVAMSTCVQACLPGKSSVKFHKILKKLAKTMSSQ